MLWITVRAGMADWETFYGIVMFYFD